MHNVEFRDINQSVDIGIYIYICVYCFTENFSSFIFRFTNTGLKKQLCGIYTICFFVFMITCYYKLVAFFAKSLNKPLRGNIQDRRLMLTLKSSYCKSHHYSLIFCRSPLLKQLKHAPNEESPSFMTYVTYKLAVQKVQLKDLIDYVWLSAS